LLIGELLPSYHDAICLHQLVFVICIILWRGYYGEHWKKSIICLCYYTI